MYSAPQGSDRVEGLRKMGGDNVNEKRPELTPEIEQVLSRYVRIQDEEQRLREEKSQLQDKLREHMEPAGCTTWFVRAAGQDLKVVAYRKVEVEYDEPKLQSRLGDRYLSILSPDLRKMRDALPEISPHLQPVLGRIGSPDPEKVRAAIESGVADVKEFEGAFVKSLKHVVAVTRSRQGDETQPGDRMPATDRAAAP